MFKKLLFVALISTSFSFGQHIEGTPWMEAVKKNSGATAKAQPANYPLQEIRAAFDTYWEQSGRDPNAKGSGFKQFKRWEYFWQHMVDEKGYIPSSKELWEAYENKVNGAMVPNPISDWTSIGPNRPGTIAGALSGTGRVNTVEVDPNDPNIWYAGSPAGGVWKSTDAGLNWVNLNEDFPQIGVSGIAIDPNNSDIVYIATGDDDGSDSFSVGVFKSLDGGQTWNETGLNLFNTNINTLMNEIVVDPTNSDIIWVGTTSGLQKSTDGGDTFDIMQSGNIIDFRLKPGDPNTVYAVSNSDYFRSTDGENFVEITNQIPGQSGRLRLAVTPADPEVVYIASADTGANDFAFNGIFRSSNSGETFTETDNTVDIYESNQAFFDFTIEVSLTDPDDVYVGVLNIWRSTDGADSFTRLNNSFSENAAYTHADIHTVRFFGDRLFACTDGGLYFSDNNGVSFTDRTGNMEITQFYRISVAQQNTDRIAGGTQDNSGFVRTNGNWNIFTGGDGMDYEIDPNNPDLIYGFIQFGQFLFITTNGGQSVGAVQAPVDPNDASERLDGNWVTPLDIASDGTVYSGYDRLYRLEGNEWVVHSNDFTGGNIEDIEVDPNDPNIIYAAQANALYRSSDAGVTFSLIGSVGSGISSFAINNNDSNILYVTTSRITAGVTDQAFQQATRRVFRVTFDPATETIDTEDITLNLPLGSSFFSIAHQALHTDNPIYVGTHLGVYRLDDTLTEWEEYFTGLPNVAVSDLEINPNEGLITAATYGRGIWQSPIPLQILDDDIRVIGITPSDNTIICGEVIAEIVVENNGTNPVTSVDVSFDLNGGTTQNFTWDGTINSGETATIPLPAVTPNVLSLNTLNVTATAANDGLPSNNTISSEFYSNSFAIGDAINTFDTPDENLISFNGGGGTPLWERGVPTGTLLNQASSGTQVFATNLDGNHPDNTIAFLVSGCYELSSIINPILSFDMAFDLEINFDIVFVEYSLDDGLNWNNLGSVNSVPNWYNSDRTNASSGASNDCQNCPGAQWTGTEATLTRYAYDFTANAINGETDLTGESNVIFRIVFQSDPAINQEGAVIDNFVVEGFQDDDDDDNDGILDVDDNCPLIGNVNQLDTDGDGMGDVCDDDDDGDGILDVDDNCPLMPNADQADADNDNIGDVCDDDADNDGVPNDLDLCPDTPVGTVVDVDGCPVFTLPSSNFQILTVGESCINNSNGMVQIEAAANLNYTGVLEGVDNTISATQNFTATTTFTDLIAGNYTLCITVEGQPDYENCLDIVIVEPQPLSVNAKVSTLNREITLNLNGGTNYTITLNGEVFATTAAEITLPLSKVENTLEVRTDRDCQGIHSETILLNPEVYIYPNPIAGGNLNIVIGDQLNSPDTVELSLFSIEGVEIFSKSYPVINGKVQFSADALNNGVYLLNVRTANTLLNYKIIRR